MHDRRAFTLIELIAVIIILAVLAGVALPKYFDYSERAKESADLGSLSKVTTALQLKYLENRQSAALAGVWITDIDDVDTVMESGQLPEGLTIDAGQLVDQRGNRYDFIAETISSAARFNAAGGGGGGGGGGGS